MASIFDAMFQDQTPQDYLAQDPYYLAGASIAKAPLPVANTNTQALLLPLMQGLARGGLMGYGQYNAGQTQYQNESANPLVQSLMASKNIGPVISGTEYGNNLLHSYGHTNNAGDITAPIGWTPKIGQQDMLLAAVDFQAKQEAAVKAQESANKIKEIIYGEVAKENPTGMLNAIGPDGKVDVTKISLTGADELKNVPEALKTKLGESAAVIKEARDIADAIKSGISWEELQGSKAFSGLDKTGIGLTLSNLADKLARARTGAAMNKEETTLYNKLVGGDLTATPKQVSNLLNKLANAESRMGQSTIDFYQKGATKFDQVASKDSASPTGEPVPTGEVTKSGKKVYIINGVKGVID